MWWACLCNNKTALRNSFAVKCGIQFMLVNCAWMNGGASVYGGEQTDFISVNADKWVPLLAKSPPMANG